MCNGLVPPYLSSLLPPLVGSSNPYPLRNNNDIQTLRTHTALYHNSFLPSAIREWNKLSQSQRHASSLNSFKASLKPTILKTPKHYYYGNRKLQMLHARLRTNCSALNADLFHKNIIDSPLCNACTVAETSRHYLLQCPRFIPQRNDMYASLTNFQPITVNLLLFGNDSLTYEENTNIFDAVHTYILRSKRFT